MSFFSEISPELSQQTPDELMEWFTRPTITEANEDYELLLEEVAAHLAATADGGTDFLLASIPNADENQLRAILLGLSFAPESLPAEKKISMQATALHFLDDLRPSIVAQAIDTLNHLGCTVCRNEIQKLMNHESPYVVGSVLRYLAAHFPDDAGPLLVKALDSPDAIVRENAIDELDDLGYKPALPQIKRLINDSDADVARAVRTAVANLS